MIPKSLVPNDMDEDDFARQWTSIDGIIYYEPKPNVPEPKAFYGNTQQLNTTDIVRMMSDLMESGVAVSGALQGKTPYAGTSAALYAQQTQNSSTPIATFMARFGAFAEDVGIKKLGMVRRFYDEKKYRLLAGRSAMEFPQDFDYSNMSDVEYDLSVKQSTETPVYRMIANDYLKEFWASGQIMLEDYLELADLPFSDRLLQKIQARNASAGQQGQPPLPEFQQMR